MASLYHPSQYLYPDYIFSNPLLPDGISSSDGSSGSPAATVSMHWAAGEVNNYLPPIGEYSITGCFNNDNIDTMVLPLDHYSSSTDISSSSTTTTTPAFFGSSGGLDYSSTFWPAPPPPPSYPIITGAESWEINQGRIDGGGQDPSTLKVTRYSAEEKKHRITRYLKKRSQRNFNKTIKYACRKNLADKRIRVRGRFAKNKNHDVTSSDDDQYQTLTHNYHALNIDHSRYDVNSSTATDDLSFLQMKTAASEEEWLQEAIASLMYYRILPDGSSVS